MVCLKDPCEIESFQLCHKTLALEIFYIDVTTDIYNSCCQCFAQIRELWALNGQMHWGERLKGVCAQKIKKNERIEKALLELEVCRFLAKLSKCF